MSAHHPPITCADFKDILKRLGFEPRPKKKGTTHEDWVSKDGPFRKITVDCPKAPFSQDLIKSMAAQAGVSKARIYELYFNKRA
jgi:hypothetical protein